MSLLRWGRRGSGEGVMGLTARTWSNVCRDPIVAVGNTLVVGQLQIEMRRKEGRGFDPLLYELVLSGARVASISSDPLFPGKILGVGTTRCP